MTDIVLLYLFTRVDAVRVVCGLTAVIVGLVAAVAVFIGPAWADDFADDLHQTIAKQQRLARKMLVVLCITAPLFILMPSSKDLAFIVGGKLTIEAIRTPEAKEMGGLLIDAVKSKLKEAVAK